MKLGQQVVGSSLKGTVDITGHSLGGGLASAATVVTGAKGYSFNAAGRHPNTVVRAPYGISAADMAAKGRLIDAYHSTADPLTNLQSGIALAQGPLHPYTVGPEALGRPHDLLPTARWRHEWKDLVRHNPLTTTKDMALGARRGPAAGRPHRGPEGPGHGHPEPLRRPHPMSTLSCSNAYTRSRPANWLGPLGLLFLLFFFGCSMSDPTNPIYREAPETYFPAAPALDLAKAIRADDVAAIDQLFAKHPQLDPNVEGQRGGTLLFWAYAHHHVAAMKALVAHGADPNRPLRLADARMPGGIDSTHLLNIATKGPKDELLVALLELGADPNVKDARQEPALLNAVYINNYGRMKILLDHGADINGKDSSGATAASTLAALNNFEMVHYLLERGADWRAEDGSIAFHVQESAVGNEQNVAWQIKVKHWLMAHGVKFPVPTAGAKLIHDTRQRWEQTPEGHEWRARLDALGSQPDVVGASWVKLEDAEFAAMKAWMEREGIAEPPL